MNDIKSRLGQVVAGEPRRPLSKNFTTQTMEKLAAQPTSYRKRLASALTGVFAMHKLSKPAALVVGITVAALSIGTGYAALQWLQPRSTVDNNTITTLPNGNTRFWVHSDSCQGQGNQTTPDDSYYEIKAGSKVTPDDIRQGIEASCESDLLPELFPGIKNQTIQNFKPGDKQYYTPWVKIKEVGKDYIVTESQINGRTYGDARLSIDKSAKFFEKGQSIKLDQFKSGDWVTLISYTTSLDRPFLTESTSPDQLEAFMENGFPKGTRIEGMIKRMYDPEKSMSLMGVMGQDYTRLERDNNAPDGWRQVIPFDHDWDRYKKQFENQQ